MSEAQVLQMEGERLTLHGALTFATVPAIEARLNGNGLGTLKIFDLSEVTDFDSAGLALLVVLAARLDGEKPQLTGVSAEIVSHLAMGGVADLFTWESAPSPA